MRILHVSQVARAGVGTVIDLIFQQRVAGHEHLAVVPAREAGDLVSGIPCRTYAGTGRGPGSLWRMVKQVRAAVRDFDPDIIFVHSSFAMIVLPVLRLMRLRAKMIYCPHGWAVARYGPGPKRWLVRQIEGRLPGVADVVVNISDHDAAEAAGLGYVGRHIVIENAVLPVIPEPPPEVANDPARITLVFVGRMARQKGLDILLAGFARAARADLDLLIVGGTAEEIGPVPPGVRCLGWRSKAEVAGLIGAADALIVPSRWEGFGLVVAEGFAQGTPALVSRRGHLPALVDAGVTGAVFDLDVAALARCLSGLDKAALAAMRPACRAVAQTRFSAVRYGAQITDLFAELGAVEKTGPKV